VKERERERERKREIGSAGDLYGIVVRHAEDYHLIRGRVSNRVKIRVRIRVRISQTDS
jgi:hypothetical protein